ncbi:hypothetical protein AJ80_09889 [Polytolypa hystricis UAMH7299]|uniref:Uncharacterized protein n=1 Tax=Polytolypa hystricis (strain UAMH7299) TaxID=1447883 RepID=A0A2B7WH63_POLH7|nr:hypothetical protein AJ80_09889 [Polytolypa hystricis UAMH7299]
MGGLGMETVSARLATFEVNQGAGSKGRTSGAKAATKAIAWPHERPSPEELAEAGFYYRPIPLSPDNAACYLCERALDGWEEDDDPVTEHLRHSSACGWAIMMDIKRRSSNPAEIEDPTSDKIVEARRATFASIWPHDGKRGWVCRTEKMVEAGWYFCPNEESEDFVSCAYCNLSLDGWEPKDDPFDEHHRRSPDCSFFVFASTKPAKSTRGRKTRTSKTSRLSTQSNATTISETPSVDLDDAMDTSVLSQATAKAGRPKKGTKGRPRATKSKKEEHIEASSQADIESQNGDVTEPAKVKRTTRGKKRKSDAIEEDANQDRESSAPIEPPPKRRATRTRGSAAQGTTSSLVDRVDAVVSDAESMEIKPKPSRTKAPKRSSSTRKPSASTASKASLRSRAPNHFESEAATQAMLDAEVLSSHGTPVPDHQADVYMHDSPAAFTASVAPAHRAEDDPHGNDDREDSDAVPPKPAKTKAQTRKRAPAKKPSQVQVEEEPVNVNSRVSQSTEVPAAPDVEQDNSVIPEEPLQQDSPEDEIIVVAEKPAPKKVGKAKAAANKSSKGKSQQRLKKDSAKDATPPAMDEDDLATSHAVDDASGKDLARGIRKASHANPEVSPKLSRKQRKPPSHQSAGQRADMERIPQRVVESPAPPTPKPYVQESTPSPSPQSSDAENRPPPTLPSSNRPVKTPAKSQTMMVPLATSTPSASTSKRALQSSLSTTHPWDPADIDEILLKSLGNKENTNFNDLLHAVKGDLTSPEKRMTVEEWILWNAKNGEEKLRNECERLVGVFEKEGGRAMTALEGIECTD